MLLATLNSNIQGVTSGEHSGHDTPHSPLPITGKISSAVSDFVFISGVPIALHNSVTTEYDGCCGSSSGVVTATTSLLFHSSTKVARVSDPINTHSGSGSISATTHDFVFSQ